MALGNTIVGDSAYHAYDEPAAAHGMSAAPLTVICVLPQQAGVFFVNADSALDMYDVAIMTYERSGLQRLCWPL